MKAAGVLFTAPDGAVLLLRRAGADHPGEWDFPGGGAEDGEAPEDTARRETLEETGAKVDGPLAHWVRRTAEDVDFTNYRVDVEAPFVPKLNDEHDGFVWADRRAALNSMPLHPGARAALTRFDMDELDVAKAIRDGTLTGPHRHNNVLLVALRITGTGAAYRDGKQEFVWRDSSLYLNDEFLERCQGLPVIVEHPQTDVLDTTEFHERIAGTIMLPYIQGTEVWGIAKIYDEGVAKMLESEQLSTSPAVLCGGSKYRTGDGKPLLIEGKPSLLDHLAIVERGVWDKGGQPTGVSNSQEDTAMVDEAKKDGENGGEGDAHGEKLDKVLAHLDSLHAKHDAMNAKHDALAARLDALEAKGKEAENTEAAVEPEPVAADAAEEEKAKADAAKKDAEEQAKKDASEKEEMKKDAEVLAANTALKAQIAELERRIPVELPEADRARFIDAQMKAERVAQTFGDSAGAPRWANGETLAQYQRRLASKYKGHSPAWKDKDLAKLDASVLDVVADQIYADAIAAAINPANIERGTLMERTETDRTNRRITKFFGDPEACWGPFKQPVRIVTGWQTKFTNH